MKTDPKSALQGRGTIRKDGGGGIGVADILQGQQTNLERWAGTLEQGSGVHIFLYCIPGRCDRIPAKVFGPIRTSCSYHRAWRESPTR